MKFYCGCNKLLIEMNKETAMMFITTANKM